MNLEKIKEFLYEHKGYLKKSPYKIAMRLNIPPDEVGVAFKALAEVKQELREESFKPVYEGKILIYDIETSPNIGWFWKAGFKQTINTNQILKERAIICVSYKWLGEDQVYNLTWDENQNDYFLLEQFINVLNEADLIVAHNGDNFDLKWLRTRALFHNLSMLPKYKQFDTLKLAKNKLYFNSNRLDYISKFLGFEGKVHTSPELWDKVTIRNDREALKQMLDYCDEDVRQLEKVYNKLKYVDNPQFHTGVLEGKGKETSPITGSSNIEHVKQVTTNRGTIKHIMKDLSTQRYFEMCDTVYQKYYNK